MLPFYDPSLELMSPRLLTHLLEEAHSPAILTALTATAKHALFPHGYPLPTPPDPLSEEQMALHERIISFRPKGALGSSFMLLFLGSNGGDEGSRATIQAALEPLTCVECNVHLTVFIMDKLLLWLWPELGPSRRGLYPDIGTNHEDQANKESKRKTAPREQSREVSLTPPGSFRQG